MYTDIKDIKYKIVNNEITIKKINSDCKQVDIPPIYNISGINYKVTKIENTDVFKNVESIILPSTINYIGLNAFNHSPHLKNIEVNKNNNKFCSEKGILFNKDKTTLIKVPPVNKVKDLNLSKIKSIKQQACQNCINLKNVTLGDKIKTLGASTFNNCINLEYIKLSNNLESIGCHCFDGCEKIKEINLPDTLQNIGAYGFFCCSSITKINIPDNVTLIGTNCFTGCHLLKNIKLPKSIKVINPDIFTNTSIENLILPENVKLFTLEPTVGTNNVKNIYIPNNLSSINPTYITSLFPSIKTIYSLNIEGGEKIINFLEKVGVNVYTVNDINKLEEQGFDFSQINQILKGYENGLIMTGVNNNISSEIMRDLIICWDINKIETLKLLSLMENKKTLDITSILDIHKKILNIKNEKRLDCAERDER